MPNLYSCLVLLVIINLSNCAFLNGVSLEAYEEDFRTSKGTNYWLAKVAQEFKANVIEIQQFYSIDNSSSTDIYPSSSSLSDESLTAGVSYANSQGLQVIFKFSLICENGEPASSIGRTFSASQWTTFFNNYGTSVQYYANLLGNTVDYFVVGAELQRSHVSYASRWTTIVNGVRGVPFNGKIGYYTSTFDIDSFVSKLDFVYVSNNAISLTTTANPSVADLKSAWIAALTSLRGQSCSYNKTFVIDLFYPSVTGTVTKTNVTDTSGLPVDLNAQATAFQGAYAALSEHTAWLGGIIASRIKIQDPVGPFLPGPSLNAKPAFNVVRNWVSTLLTGAPSCPINNLYNLDTSTEQDIFTEGLNSNLKDESSNYAKAPNYSDPSAARSGSVGLSVNLNEGGSLQIRWLPILMVNSYPFFEFYIKSTQVTRSTLYFSLGVSGGVSTEQVLIESTAAMNGSYISGAWRRVLIDVQAIIGPQEFSGRTSWDNIIITYYSGNTGSTSGMFYIDDIKIYGHTTPSCPGQCNYPNRKGCLQASGCGYCGSTQTCQSGNAFSSASGTLCYSWLYNDPEIRVLPTSGPDTSPCDQYDSCFNCADDPMCGWCAISNQCSMKNATKPICGTCTDYFTSITECKTVNTKPSQRLLSFYPLQNDTFVTLLPQNTSNVFTYLTFFPQFGTVEVLGTNVESPYGHALSNLTYHYTGATVGLDQMGYTVYDNLRGITFMNVTINFNLSYLVFGILPTTGASTSTTGADALKGSSFQWKMGYTIAVAVVGGIIVLIAILVPVIRYVKNQPRIIKYRKPKDDKRMTDVEMSNSTSSVDTSRNTVTSTGPSNEYNLNLAVNRPSPGVSPGVSRETNNSSFIKLPPSNNPSNEYNLNLASNRPSPGVSRETNTNSSFMIPRQNNDNGSRGVRPPRPPGSPYGGTKQGYSWEIQYHELEFGDAIGSGSFGQVYRGTWRKATVAIKVVLNTSEEDRKAFEKEADLMKAIRPHSHVVGFQGLCVYQGQVMIVTEFCERGDLRTYIAKNPQIDRKSTIKWLRGIAAGMLHISSEGLVHRDLAARNVLLSGNLEAKITDFGMSRLVDSAEKGGKTESNVGPLKWMAPESLIDNIYSMKSDVYSFGVLIWEVLCRSDPYPNLTGAQVAAKVGQGLLTLEKPSIFPDIGDVMVKCLQRDPNRRPDFAQICDLLPQH